VTEVWINPRARFDPHFNRSDPILTAVDLSKWVSMDMAENASACAVRNIRGAAKRASMLKTIEDSLYAGCEKMPATVTFEGHVITIELGPDAESAEVTIRPRTTLDAMKEAACGK
jgi:hypothetical protein